MKAKWNQGKPMWFEGNEKVRPLIIQELIDIFGLIPSKYGTRNAIVNKGIVTDKNGKQIVQKEMEVIQYECYPDSNWYLNSDGVDFWYSNGEFQRYLVMSELKSIAHNLDYRKREIKKSKKSKKKK